MKQLTVPIFLPNKGPVLNSPQEFLMNQVSPYSRNMEVYNDLIQGRSGVAKLLSTALSGRILSCPRLRTFSNNWYYLFCTPKDIYALDYGNSRFDILTPVYTTGKVRVESGSAVVTGGLEVDNCDTSPVAWADGSGGDVTPSRETTSPKDGTAFVRLTAVAGAGVELLAYHDISSVDLSAYDSIGFWIRSSVSLAAGDLQFLLDNSSACATPLETLDIPAITANTWTWVNIAFATPANLTGVVSIGIKQAVDKGAMTVDIDQVVAGDWSGNIGVGDYFKIGSTGIHTGATWYEVLTVDSDTKITLTAVYAGSSANQQTYAIRQIFQGGDEDYWDWEQFLDGSLGEVAIMTNGIDTPVYWTGTGQVVAMSGFATGFTTAKFVDVYKDRVLFLYTVEGGQNQPQRCRWGDVANCLSYQDEDFRDFVDEPTFITGTARIAGYHVVFKETNAYVGRWVGGDEIFDWDLSGECQGVRSRFSIVEDNRFIAYYGNDKKFHKWNLLQDTIISEEIFPETKEFDPNTDEFVQGFKVPRKNQIRWFCPYGDVEKHNYTVVWDYQRDDVKVWQYEQADACCSAGVFYLTSDIYADDPVFGELYADETEGYADESTSLANAAIILYGGYDGYVRIGDSGTTDDGTTFTRTLRLKRLNFGVPNARKRLQSQEVWLEAESAGSVIVRMRLDDKTSFESTTKTISLIPTDEDKATIKSTIVWDRTADNFQPEIYATNHFSFLGLINNLYLKGYRG